MRMRFKPYARPELLACDYHAHAPLENKGRWHSVFARPQQPVHLELGCGKGGFLARLASAHPDINYLGIDITDKVLILAKRNIERIYAEKGMTPDNVMIMSLDIERILNAFDERDTVQRIYINFCNPWNRKSWPTKNTGSPTPASWPSTAPFWRKTEKFTSRPTTMISSATALPTSRKQATRSCGRPSTCMPTSRTGTSAPSTRPCSPSRAFPPRR